MESKFQKYVVPAVGFAAFVVGGLLARKKAEEGVNMLRGVLDDSSPTE